MIRQASSGCARGLIRVRQCSQQRLQSSVSAAGGSVPAQKKESEFLQKIDIEDLPRAQRRFAKQFEKVNEERIKEIFAKNYKNHIAFSLLVVLVGGIYWYTLYAVKQETFLEEIDAEMAVEKPQTHAHLMPAPKQ